MVYVKQGADGRNEDFQVTKMPTDQQGALWMRYYMKEKGMAPSEAWQTFWKDTKEIVAGQVGMLSGASKMPRMPRAMSRPSTNTSPRLSGSGSSRSNITSSPTKQPSVAANAPSTPKKPTTDIGKASTPHAPAPAAGSKAGKTGETSTAVKSNKSSYEVNDSGANQKKDLQETKTDQSKSTKTSKANRPPGSTAAEADPVLRGLDKRSKDLKDIAGDHVAGGKNLGRDLPISVIKERLKGLAEKGDQNAARLLREIENVQKRQQERARELGLIP